MPSCVHSSLMMVDGKMGSALLYPVCIHGGGFEERVGLRLLLGAWGAGDWLRWNLILCYWDLDCRNVPGPWAAGRAKLVRREGCVRWERCTHRALSGETGSSLCLRPAAKKVTIILCPPALLPAAVLSSLSPRVQS